MRRYALLLFVAIVALAPAAAVAQETERDGGLALRLGGDYMVGEADVVEAAIVVDGDADVAGHVEDLLLVVNGDADVSGTVDGTVVMINGTLRVADGGMVNDVSLIRSDLEEAPGATVAGEVNEATQWGLWASGAIILFGLAFWVAMTFAVLVGALVFAAVAGRQLSEGSRLMSDAPGQSILSGIIAFVGLPIVAVFAMLTIIGIPLGLGMLLFLLPMLSFLGYIVAGTWLGRLILSRTVARGDGGHPYREALVGVLILQLAVLIPGLAPAVFVVGSVWGTGALAYTAYRNLRRWGGDIEREASPPPPQPAPGE